MKRLAILLLIFVMSVGPCISQSQVSDSLKNKNAGNKPYSTTIPFVLDHNRILIAAETYLPGGRIKKIKVWVDNGTPGMAISEHLANELGLVLKHAKTGDNTSAAPPKEMLIGGLRLDLNKLQQVEVEKGSTVGSGMEVDMNLPSSVLCNYDVVIDYPGRLITIAKPGSVHFRGKAVAGYFNPKNHLIQLPAKLGDDHFNLALDAGTPVTFIDNTLVSKFSKNHPEWPSMYGAVGIANLWGLDDEPNWHLLQAGQLFYGDISFPDVIIVSFPADRLDYFQKRAGSPTAGLMGAASLLNYRLGIDYVHGIVYFEHRGTPVNPDMSLIGITLRPETSGGYSVLGVALYKGQPAVAAVGKGDILLRVNDTVVNGLTMGEVWSLLRGTQGTVRKLVLIRQGKKFTVDAVIHCLLCNSVR